MKITSCGSETWRSEAQPRVEVNGQQWREKMMATMVVQRPMRGLLGRALVLALFVRVNCGAN